MPPVVYDLTIEKRASFTRKWFWLDKNKRPIDLTGYAAKLQVRESASNPNVLFELSTSDGSIKLGGKGGSVAMFVSDAVTSELTFTNGIYDFVFTAPNGTKIRAVEGDVYCPDGVTR